MGWACGYDPKWQRDVGYGVPSICDRPGCGKQINRGLTYVCGSDPLGGEYGCGLYFCEEHLGFGAGDEEDRIVLICARCGNDEQPYEPTPDTHEWLEWKLSDESWEGWRQENPDEAEATRQLLAAA